MPSSPPTEKNELHLDPTAAAARGAGRANGEEDAEMLLADQDELRDPGASAPRGGTANLYQKKARLSQPSAPAAAQ
jgi:cullin-4